MKVIVQMAIVLTLSGCREQLSPITQSHRVRYSNITFNLSIDEQDNETFRIRLINMAGSHRSRRGIAGIDLDSVRSPEYSIDIAGRCEGAIGDLGDDIIRESRDLQSRSDIVRSYFSSARCNTKSAIIEGNTGT